MKKFLLCALIVIVGCCLFTACEKEGSMSKYEIVGEWFAEHRYSRHTIQWTLDFDSNKKGNSQYHRISDGYATWANFTWKISGGKVICTGVKTASDGYVDYSWDQEFIIDGNTLVCGDFVFHKLR